MIEQTFNEVKMWAYELVKSNAPYRTGDLMRSFKLIEIENGFRIETDIEHMKYTEEAWTFNSRWGKTLQNKHEGWFRRTALIIAEEMARRLGGVINVIT